VVLNCLATWQDGSDFYLYGTFASEGVVSKEDFYRCFVSRTIDAENFRCSYKLIYMFDRKHENVLNQSSCFVDK